MNYLLSFYLTNQTIALLIGVYLEDLVYAKLLYIFKKSPEKGDDGI